MNNNWWQPKGKSQGGTNPGQGWVYYDRNWRPAGEHPGGISYDYPAFMQAGAEGGTAPYYANDVSSALMQQAFPGAVAGYGFSSSYLEPRRQRGIVDLLNMTGNGRARADAFQAGVGQTAMSQANRQSAMFGGGKNFKASALLAAQNNAQGASNQYRAQVTDPLTMARQRQAIIEAGYNNPLADQVRGWMPGLEPQRQNNSIWGSLLNAGLNYFGGGGGLPNFGGGGGGNPYNNGLGISLSDRRLKKNIVHVATMKNGLKVYEYDIFGKRTRGVMADEVEKKVPGAVYKAVDYSQLLEAVR